MKAARALGLLAYLVSVPALAQAAGEPAVNLTADTLAIDVPTETYQARGSVRLERAGVSLLADSVIYHRLTEDAVAEGNIFMEKAGDTLKGDRLSLNLETQRGELLNGQLFIKASNFRLAGKRVEKTGDEDYHVERGSFTTCDGDLPSWHFEARDLKVTLDDFATGRDAVFYVGKVPVLYSPYLLFPVNKDRQSGLLLPQVGHSTKKGAYYVQPYYWAPTPSQDATFDLDLESSRGVGVGVDYRYLRHQGSEGTLQTFGIYDTTAEKFRGELNQRHLELVDPSLTLASDIHLITDRSYFRDFSENSGEYNRQLLQSNASFDKRWERFGVNGEFRYVEDLVAANNNATLQTLPTLNFVAAGSKLGPAYFSMDNTLVNFQRVDGITGQRLTMHPRLTVYEKPAGVLDWSLYGGYRQQLYNLYGSGSPGGLQQQGQADAGSVLSLPLARVYEGRYRHLMVPTLEYSYLQTPQALGFTAFDRNDQVPGHNALLWSVSNYVTEKIVKEGGGAEYRDLLYLKLSQGYWFTGERLNLLYLDRADAGHRFDDLLVETKVSPTRELSIAGDGRYNPVDNTISTANLAVEFRSGTAAAAKMVQVGYRYSREELSYLEGRFALPLTSQLSASVLGRYSFDKGDFLESRYSLEYKRQCWGIIATYTDRPDNKSFTVNFTLAGVGSLVPIRAF
jgi:LPS-assembly protein